MVRSLTIIENDCLPSNNRISRVMTILQIQEKAFLGILLNTTRINKQGGGVEGTVHVILSCAL